MPTALAREPTPFGGLPGPLDCTGADLLLDEGLGDAFALAPLVVVLPALGTPDPMLPAPPLPALAPPVLALPAPVPPAARCLTEEPAEYGLPTLEPVAARVFAGTLLFVVLVLAAALVAAVLELFTARLFGAAPLPTARLFVAVLAFLAALVLAGALGLPASRVFVVVVLRATRAVGVLALFPGLPPTLAPVAVVALPAGFVLAAAVALGLVPEVFRLVLVLVCPVLLFLEVVLAVAI